MPNTVFEKMLSACADAYLAQTPLLFLDTDDLELAEKVVLLGHETDLLVPLVLPRQRGSDMLAPYYRYLKNTPGQFERCLNLSFRFADLDGFPTDQEGHPPADPAGPPIFHPFLFLLHVDEDTSPEQFARLQNYVARYLHNGDPQSLLRRSCVVLYGNVTCLPEYLQNFTAVVQEPYPTTTELHTLLLEEMNKEGLSFKLSSTGERIARDLTGFPVMQAIRLIRRLLQPQQGCDAPRLFSPQQRTALIRREKQTMLLQTGDILELVKPREAFPGTPSLCGMGRFNRWADQHTGQMSDPQAWALNRGTPPLKGLLMCGVPGCGKSEAAHMLAKKWDLPLVKLNMDRLMGGLVGESERNLRTALAQAESMAPAILWMDEVDKALSGASASNKNDTTFQRMFGRLLQWMQSNDRGCFVFATANDLSCLPPEFLRKGRFDSLWAVYLPTEEVCKQIFRAQMDRAEELRRREAQSQGKPAPGPLFSRDPLSDCYSADTMDTILSHFGEGRFLTPSDISTLVTESLNSLTQEEMTPVIHSDAWKTAILRTAEDFVTDAGSHDSLSKIAACYIRLLRGPFKAAADDSELLFLKKHYRISAPQDPNGPYPIAAGYDSDRFQSDSRYDRELFETLSALINRYATEYESRLLRQTFSAGFGG